VPRQDVDPRSDRPDHGCPDVGNGISVHDILVALDLAAVRIALDHDVQNAERPLGGMPHLARQQDAAGADAPGRNALQRLGQWFAQAERADEAQHRRAFPARQDEPVASGEVLRTTDFARLRPQGGQMRQVGCHGAL